MSVLALELATTVRHDGQGGIADSLETVAGVEDWLQRNAALVAEVLGRHFDPAALHPEKVQQPLLEVRRAVRSLFARAVSPEPPSKADANNLLDPVTALSQLNDAASQLGAPHLDWPEDGDPVTRWAGRSEQPVELLLGAIGRSGIEFLTGPDRVRLRACPAARCVKYFLQDDPRQTWCTPSCGNRERVNRHYQRKHTL